MDDQSVKPAKQRIKLHKKFHNEVMKWLRKSFSWSGIKTMVKARARIKRGVYGCEYCGKEVGPKQFDIDHFLPIIDVKDNWTTGYSYSEIVERLFDMENVFLVCFPCHTTKTGKENSERKKGVPRRSSTKKKIKKAWNKPEMKEFASSRRKGKKNSKTQIEKFKLANSGEKHWGFGVKGYDHPNSGGEWITPAGKFGSTPEAGYANGCASITVHRHCLKTRDGVEYSPAKKLKYKEWGFIPKKL